MLDVLLFLKDNNVTTPVCTGGIADVVGLAKMIIRVLQIAVPVGLIIMGTIDMGKSVIAGDEKKIKENQGKFVKRIISAIIVFLIPLIVNLVLNFVVTGSSEWIDCWNNSSWGGAINVSNDLSKPNAR